MANFQDLPTELLPIVFQHLHPFELKRVRLVNKALAFSIARWMLFRHVILYCDTASFGRLQQISETPELASMVTKVTYSGAMVPYYEEWVLDYEEWLNPKSREHDGFDWLNEQSPSGALRDGTVLCRQVDVKHNTEAHAAYTQQVLSQGDVIQPPYELNALTKAFTHLENLQHIEVDCEFDELEYHPCATENIFLKDGDSLAHETLTPRSFYGGHRRHHKQLMVLMDAAASHSPSLTSLTITDVNLNNVHSMHEQIADPAPALTRRLQQLNVKVLSTWDVDALYSHVHGNEIIAKWIEFGSQSLTSLCLEQHHLKDGGTFRTVEYLLESLRHTDASLRSVLGDKPEAWPQLTTLKLAGYWIEASHLLDFLQHSANNLRSLSLSDMLLCSPSFMKRKNGYHPVYVQSVPAAREGDWMCLLEDIRALGLPHLETFELGGFLINTKKSNYIDVGERNSLNLAAHVMAVTENSNSRQTGETAYSVKADSNLVLKPMTWDMKYYSPHAEDIPDTENIAQLDVDGTHSAGSSDEYKRQAAIRSWAGLFGAQFSLK